jgi:arylsulfatase
MLSMKKSMKRAIAISLLAAACAVHAQGRPNVVIFIGDDISADDFGCYGHPTIKTPNVDQLAGRGVRFSNAYLTAPSCSPSRTSLITGRYPHSTGGPELHMKKNPHLAGLPQFPHELRKAGYYTALAGKAHFNGDARESFDHMHRGGKTGAENWIQALKDRPKDKPFLMWLAAIDAHRPWDMDLSDGPHGPEDAVVPPYLVDAERTRKDLAQYYNEVHRFDANIGKVVAELKAQGVYENTVIIVMADNGRPFPRDKTWIFDGGIKTPLILHWPGRITESRSGAPSSAAPSSAPAPDGPAPEQARYRAGPRAGTARGYSRPEPGLTCESLVSSIDIAPTVLHTMGLPVPADMDG